MQRYGAARRQFYAAFYQWTVRSGIPPKGCTGLANVSRRNNSSKSSEASGLLAKHDKGTRSKVEGTPVGGEFIISTEELEAEPLNKVPIKGRLKPWQFAVRGRRKNGWMSIELMAPTHLAREEHIIRKAKDSFVTMTVEDNPRVPADERKIFLSGKPDMIRKVLKMICVSGGALENTNTTPEVGDNMRLALRHLTQPVALVTSTLPLDPTARGSRGVTVSSFSTVTLNPRPVVSFNLKVPSRTWDAIDASQRICIHLLRATPEGAAVAHAFTLPYEQAHGPFDHLERFVGQSRSSVANTVSPPQIDWPEAVHMVVEADVMRDECVTVGDHIVVLAKVTNVKSTGSDVSDTGLLAYGRRSYRQLGEELQPLEPPGSETGVGKGGKIHSTEDGRNRSQIASMHEQVKKNEETTKDISEIESSSPILDEESLRSEMEKSETSYKAEGFPNQTAAKQPVLEEALKAAAGAWIAPPDTMDQKQASKSEYQGSQSATQSARDFNKTDNPLHRTFSTFTKTSTRSYSTKTNNSPPIPDRILKSTVGSYLVPPPMHHYSWRSFLKHNRENAARIETLERALEEDTLTPEEISQLESEITAGERKTARLLAHHHAAELTVMLDQGGVEDDERVQMLEAFLEQGQAATLLEAKVLKREYGDGIIELEEYEKMKDKMTQQYDGISAVLMRLRDLFEEDDYHGRPPAEAHARGVHRNKGWGQDADITARGLEGTAREDFEGSPEEEVWDDESGEGVVEDDVPVEEDTRSGLASPKEQRETAFRAMEEFDKFFAEREEGRREERKLEKERKERGEPDTSWEKDS